MSSKWVNKVIDISRVYYRKIVIKVLVKGFIISVISLNDPQGGLDDSQKDDL